ncbi:hypothetical protein [Paenibacillus turpanensis]|uniref:hypothetical protein n=1 Tax=Paenibacillus turpanensis TaxID=2689078 RepID=UPI001408B056|nr:hypothetical protein [Paenibacillus turpanensis]
MLHNLRIVKGRGKRREFTGCNAEWVSKWEGMSEEGRLGWEYAGHSTELDGAFHFTCGYRRARKMMHLYSLLLYEGRVRGWAAVNLGIMIKNKFTLECCLF